MKNVSEVKGRGAFAKRWDLTLSLDKSFYEASSHRQVATALKSFFEEYCDKFVFQLECSEDDDKNITNLHFQCRVSFVQRLRKKTILNMIEEEFENKPFYNCWISPTSKRCRNFNYVMKIESRLAGPWADRPFFAGKSILPDSKLKPWMIDLVKKIEAHGDTLDQDYFRTIYHVLDEQGNNMKSSFVKYLLHKYGDNVGLINPFGTANSINQVICTGGAKKLYLLDMPRPYSWEVKSKNGAVIGRKWNPQWFELSHLLEKVKDGALSGTMYGESSVLLMEPPFIIIFSNWPLQEEDGDIFSYDRIKVIDLEECNAFEDQWDPMEQYLPIKEDIYMEKESIVHDSDSAKEIPVYECSYE